MQGSNEAAFDLCHIGARHCGGTSGRACPSLQAPNAVVARCRSYRGEHETRRQMLQNVRHGLRDRVMTSRRTPGLVKLRVFKVDLPDRRDAPRGVMFAEHQIEVGLHECLEIHPCPLLRQLRAMPWMTKRSRFGECPEGSPRHPGSNQPAGFGTGVLSSCCSHR